MRKPWPLITGLVAFSLASLAVSVMTGSIAIPSHEIWAAINGTGNPIYHSLIFDLRLPRSLSAFAVGGMLGLAGALMQALLRNPLADPYILGISGGGAVGALTALLLGLGSGWITGSAFAGAMLTIGLVFALAHGSGSWTATRLLLTGVVIAAGWGAVISFILSVSPDTSLRGMLFWMMGDLADAEHPATALIIMTVGLLCCLPIARPLNVLARGELQAGALGVSVSALRMYLYIIASLLTASAVTTAGSIGFIGLIIPHLLRLATGSDHRLLLPASVLLGGGFLVLADTLSRTVIAPQQLPVGVITAVLGVPVFLYLLQRQHRP